jgi:hypothetical protein
VTPKPTADVARVLAGYPARIRRRLLALRRLIFATAAATPGVGALTETLKWGEPAYVTAETGSGSTIRLGWKQSSPTQYALFMHCQTNLIATFRRRFPELEFEGNRAIVFEDRDALPAEPVRHCIAGALTYHQRRGHERRRS